jgi:molybdopterin-biosynthesis enzyme MoeA-like protein
MQKLIKIWASDSNLEFIEKEYSKNGWIIKQITGVGDNLVLLLEKDTRKEKLEKLNEL